MTRRLIVSNLVLISIVLLFLEVPLGLVYSRHEHDALTAALSRDAASLASLAEEIVENPGEHDVEGLARRFAGSVGGDVVIVDRAGRRLASAGPTAGASGFQAALLAARAGHPGAGELGALAYATATFGTAGQSRGAVLAARDDSLVDRRVGQFWLALLAIGAAVLAISTIVSRQLARWAVGPLRELDETAEEFGRGQLGVRAQAESGPPEVAALAGTFNEMADRIDALVESQRRFVADASHQLRTPLTALRLRLENLDPDDAAAVDATREAALHETMRLSRLVDGLLALARAEGHRPQREPVDVGAVVAERHDAWAPVASEGGVDLQLDAAQARGATARLVPGQLEQILDNLIDNALEATPSGRVVRLVASTNGSLVEIHVSDDGRGMTVEQRQHAFDAFWQGTEADSAKRAGLGLAIVEQLVRTNRGSISLEASPTGGVDAAVRFSRIDT
ncbi:MAG TPA: HAMP domain-containing sensor histidine kinase [Acidimicrobiales bacterium]|nr:HAMP domain-containing sensor histidine kinase [Acidimicrobiales bacterium]